MPSKTLGTATSEYSSIVFAGITSIDQVNDSSMRLNWTSNADAIGYGIYNVTSGVPVFLTMVNGQASSSYTVSPLSSATLYSFRVRAMDSSSKFDNNTTSLSATTSGSASAPTALTLISPSSTPDVSDTPTVRVTGVKSGDSVKLYSDNCATEVATATAAGATIDLTSSSLAVGSYNFYAKSGSSACSTATLAYTRVACAAGYILSGGICLLSFAGITSITNVTDTTLTLNWTSHASAAYYKVSSMTAGVPTFVTAVNAPASSVNLTGTPNTSYTFRVRAYDVTDTGETNAAVQTTTTNLAPDVPSALALQSPNYTPAMTATLTVRISGVKNGDTIKLFTNNTCTTQVASGVASGTTIDLTATSLAVAIALR